MAATALFSRHSSNPMEVSSSDARNRAYLKTLMQVEQEYGGDEPSSDDPISHYNIPQMEQYHSHLAQLYPNVSLQSYQYGPSTSKAAMEVVEDAEGVDDVDEEMGGEDGSDEEMANGTEVVEAAPPEPAEEEGSEDEDEEEEEEDEDDETDEELTIYLKSRDERAEIAEEIIDLETAVPQLIEDYKIIDRLGTGTFSAVYKAIDLGYHSKWDNAEWHGHHSPSSSAYYQTLAHPPGRKVFVAIKRIYVTSGPERIRNEIAIMEDCRGCRHVSQLITAFRQHDQVVAIMPFHKNEDFRDYYKYLPLEGVKMYFRCMFRALRDIHARGIVHRDVKPANFLFDPRTGVGTLCDFGLACRVERGPTLGACLHTKPTREYPHGRLKSGTDLDLEIGHIKQMQREARLRSAGPSDKVGYPEKDTRPHSKANRAGTRGFRAPEVLLKCGEQTGAIDVWAAGMILLFFLTKKFPLFQSNDDTEALMEIAMVVGRRKMEKTATLHSRVFQTNVPSLVQEGIPWPEFVERQNPNVRLPNPRNPNYYPYNLPEHRAARSRPPPSSSSPARSSSAGRASSPASSELDRYSAEIDTAFDFLERVMQPESIRRMTPRAALYHPFLRDPDAPEDDKHVPHPFGNGVCGHLHWVDDADDLCVRVRVDGREEWMVRKVQAGEGIAIGQEPCQFHRNIGL